MSTENSVQSSNTTLENGEFMLFGVRVRVDPMRKSVSLNNLAQYEVPNIEFPNAGDGPSADVGYASANDASHRKASGGGSRERKRGVQWTEEEHKLFLLGLQKVGKGDWRGISRNFVKTRTPTQVASHAQKYFLRRSSLTRRRRRSSLFDITTDSVTAVPMEENVHQERKVQPLLSPAQLPPVETSIISGPQLFPVTMCPISVSTQTVNSMEKFHFGHLGCINHNDSAEFVHQVPVLQVPTQTRMVDFNLNQRLAEDPSLSLDLSLSLDQVQGQFMRHTAFEAKSSFNNGDSMISVA